MTKKGSGRTKGATSCVLVPLHRIVERFGDVEVAVPVNRKWAKDVGLTVKYVEVEMDEVRLEANKTNIRDISEPIEFTIK